MRNTSLIQIERSGCWLMLHRNKKENDENHDKWVGIGGKFCEGESPEECAQREAYEETGLILRTKEYRGIVTFVSDIWGTEYMHLFTCSDFDGTLSPCDEGELAWVKKDDVFNLPIWEGDKIFLRLLETSVPFFSLKLCYEGDRLVNAVLNEKMIPLPCGNVDLRSIYEH